MDEVGRFAQRLILQDDSRLNKMLFHFPNLQDLAFWVDSSTDPVKLLLPTLEKLSLKRLSADFEGLDHDDYLSSTFSNITHLDVIGFHGCTWKEWEVLSKLPHLTHLMIGFLVDFDVFTGLLRHASQLRILVFMPVQEGDIAVFVDKNRHKSNTNDDRLVLLKTPSHVLVEDWLKGGELGLDSWTFCELVLVARKRRFNLAQSHHPFCYLQKYFFITASVGKFFLDNPRQWFERTFDWDKNLNDDGKQWYRELNWQDPWSFD